MFKKMRSRKFFVLILFAILTWTAYYITLIVSPPGVLNSAVFIAIMSTQAFFGAAYIGANVLQKLIEFRALKSSDTSGKGGNPVPATGMSAIDRIKKRGG